MEIRQDAIELLNHQKGNLTLYEYVAHLSNNDPGFYQWLFPNATNIRANGDGMTRGQYLEFQKFSEEVRNFE